MIEDKIKRIERNVKKVEEQESLAMEMVRDANREKKRLIYVIIILLIAYFTTVGYLIYVLNDIEVVETTETTESYNQDIDNEGSIENTNIVNGGDVNDKD